MAAEVWEDAVVEEGLEVEVSKKPASHPAGAAWAGLDWGCPNPCDDPCWACFSARVFGSLLVLKGMKLLKASPPKPPPPCWAGRPAFD